ncbi:uncharacterized mitochondrial protein-like protein [Tanacetum coccineum]
MTFAHSNIIITGNSMEEIDQFKRLFSSKFLIKDLGELKYFLGIEVIKNETALCLTHKKYCLELLNEFGMLGCKPDCTPIEINQNKPSKKIIEKDDYPLAMHGPLKSNLKLAFRVLRYLKGAPGMRVMYKVNDNFELTAYVDSDWAKCIITRRSIIGYAVFLGSCLVSWKSKKQSVMAKASAEVEYRAAIQIAAKPVFHERTKHFEIDLYFLRDKISDGVIKTCKIQSQDNMADVLTKGLCIAEHKKFCDGLNLVNLFQI